MESRRQVTVSWDSGGSDEAPPKVANTADYMCLKKQVKKKTFLLYFFSASFDGYIQTTAFWPILSSSANTCLE